MNKNILGINGLGRIGKLVLWNQLIEKHFDEIFISLGRTAGSSLEDLIDSITNDSTYGSLDRFLYGYMGGPLSVEIINEEDYEISIDNVKIKFLTKERNPMNINWDKYGVEVVCDCTGVFVDPMSTDEKKGSLRGHIQGGAKKVVLSAPFKLKGDHMPADCTMMVYGINHDTYDSEKHNIISAASCTTTALAHMMKPLLDNIGADSILTASMSTIHAATNNQNLLDALPSASAKDLRKNRAALNNIILTSTGAAKALKHVIPEMKGISFMADSIRIPTNTVSLVSLNLTFKGDGQITEEYINGIYDLSSKDAQRGFLTYSSKQNVSSDIRGLKASAVIEGAETATKTEVVKLNEENELSVTHAKIFGWYDNEFGSYVNSLSKIIIHVHNELQSQPIEIKTGNKSIA